MEGVRGASSTAENRAGRRAWGEAAEEGGGEGALGEGSRLPRPRVAAGKRTARGASACRDPASPTSGRAPEGRSASCTCNVRRLGFISVQERVTV